MRFACQMFFSVNVINAVSISRKVTDAVLPFVLKDMAAILYSGSQIIFSHISVTGSLRATVLVSKCKFWKSKILNILHLFV